MATSSSGVKKGKDKLRREILSYKPGKAVPRDEVVFPEKNEKLVIGMVELQRHTVGIVPALRSAIHGDVCSKRRTSSNHGTYQKNSLTDSIRVITSNYIVSIEEQVRHLAGKVRCVVLLLHTSDCVLYPQWRRATMEVTGRAPLCGVFTSVGSKDFEEAKHALKKNGITDIYELPGNIHSDEGQLQWLDLLHGCLCEADAVTLYSNPQVQKSCEQERKEGKEAETSHEEEIREREEEKKLLENWKRAEQVKEINKQREIELEEELQQKDLRIKTMAEKLQRAEKTARREVERLQSEKEEMTKKLESNQHRADTLTEIVQEKGRNESAQRQVVEDLTIENKEDRARFEKEKQSMESSLKKELDSKKQHIEQLERETWKLRTKIQLESEIRSTEHKKKAETPQWMRSFIPWMAAGKQAQSGITSSGDSSSGEIYQMERSNTSQTDAEPPNDEFGDILKKIADDLSEEAKIDSLGSQLGIIQGDIARALKTNMRYEQVTSRGTHLMLKQWREGVSREDERIEMRRALVAAKLLDLADRYVPQKEAVAAFAPSNRERINLDDGEHDADEAMEGEITAQGVQPEPGSGQNNDGNNVILVVRDVEDDQAPHNAHNEDRVSTTDLGNSEEPATEKLCCSWCYPFKHSQFR